VKSEALIRFSCVVAPGGDPENIAFPYLAAIDLTGVGVRVMPLGPFQFGQPPWDRLSHLFLAPLGLRFINVVCAPACYSLSGDSTSAITGLLTIGIPNVAIMSGTGNYCSKEFAALAKYDRVICPTEEGTRRLCQEGVPCARIPAEPEKLSRLFSGIKPV
jgi:hypothetical protein